MRALAAAWCSRSAMSASRAWIWASASARAAASSRAAASRGRGHLSLGVRDHGVRSLVGGCARPKSGLGGLGLGRLRLALGDRDALLELGLPRRRLCLRSLEVVLEREDLVDRMLLGGLRRAGRGDANSLRRAGPATRGRKHRSRRCGYGLRRLGGRFGLQLRGGLRFRRRLRLGPRCGLGLSGELGFCRRGLLARLLHPRDLPLGGRSRCLLARPRRRFGGWFRCCRAPVGGGLGRRGRLGRRSARGRPVGLAVRRGRRFGLGPRQPRGALPLLLRRGHLDGGQLHHPRDRLGRLRRGLGWCRLALARRFRCSLLLLGHRLRRRRVLGLLLLVGLGASTPAKQSPPRPRFLNWRVVWRSYRNL